MKHLNTYFLTLFSRKKTKKSLTHIFHFSFFILYFSLISVAQIKVIPLQFAQTITQKPSSARTRAVTLPFFDDFSLAKSGNPDPTLWQTGGGTFVNNTLAINQPSVNVVTFDGTKANGTPYNFATELAYGRTDTLTSQVIDLSKYSSKDSLYLSFFWQNKGLVELPDTLSDSLRVQFRTNGDLWRTVWVKSGIPTNDKFNQVLVPVSGNLFLHNQFQFKFEAFGRQSGAFDAWHIDYVYLNKNRSKKDLYVKDIACRRPVTSYLKRYQSMPLIQYLANPKAETADSVQTDINNLNRDFNFTTYKYTLQDTISKTIIQQYVNPRNETVPGLASLPLKVISSSLPSGLSGKKVVLKGKFDVLTSDDQNPTIPEINLRRNDTLSSYTVLDNYYAYDDGTAEYAAYINKRLGRVAIRFILNKPDVVQEIRMNIPQTVKNLVNGTDTTRFVLQILDNKNKMPNAILLQKVVKVAYSKSVDDLIQYQMPPVAVKDTFYVAWLQTSDDFIPVGLDKNINSGQQILSNLGLEWVQNTDLKGSFLIRPVMGGTPPLATEELVDNHDIIVYPNPTNGVIRWDNEQIQEVWMNDLLGKEVFRKAINRNEERQIQVNFLPKGLYLLNLSDGKRSFVKKIILTE